MTHTKDNCTAGNQCIGSCGLFCGNCLDCDCGKCNKVTPTMATYKEVLSEQIKKEIDTDTGILRAYYATCDIMCKGGFNLGECRAFLDEVGKVWGDYKRADMRGDMLDAEIIPQETK